MTETNEFVDRRKFIQALGVATAAGLAGCGGSSEESPGENPDTSPGGQQELDERQQELGERVPSVVLEYWAAAGGETVIMEDTAPTLQQNLGELGIDVEIKPTEIATQITNCFDDTRTHHISFWMHSTQSTRLDPQEMTRRYAADWAGADGNGNPSNYANCEFTEPAINQASAPTTDRRRELVNEAHGIMSEDHGLIPISKSVRIGIARTDMVDVQAVGKGGINARVIPHWAIYSQPTQQDGIVTNMRPDTVEALNYTITDNVPFLNYMNHLVHSTLTTYDENFELMNGLADSIEEEDDGTTITVELKDGTFHNGDPITSEDVKFTYEFLANNSDVFPQASNPPYESIDVVDDKTTVFNLERPYPVLITREWPYWGVMHKQTWVDKNAQDDPSGVTFEGQDLVGSGPFKVKDFNSGRFITLEGHDGNPVHPDPGHEFTIRGFQQAQSSFQALKSGEVQMMIEAAPAMAQEVQEEMSDQTTVTNVNSIHPLTLYPQHPVAPSKFTAFRNAVGEAINRAEVSQVALYDMADPVMQGTVMTDVHPFRPPDDMLYGYSDPTGDVEKARQVLSDAGWGWDDDGNLRYPADVDTAPTWPEGEEPTEFACVGSDGGYVPPEDQ